MLHQQGLDTTGKAMFQMMGVFAEIERAMIRERVKAGFERGRAHGKTLAASPSARRPTRDPQGTERSDTGRKTAATLGIGTGTVQRIKAGMSA
jgi:DNA invertase Pin-like site-specific DNA recombinase